MESQGTEFATTIIATYGAILATISLVLSLVLAVFEIRRHRPQIRVSANHGTILDQLKGPSESLILMDAVNTGPSIVTISGVGWLLRGGSKLQMTRPLMLTLPYELQPGKKCTTFWPCRLFREHEDNEKIKAAFFNDETGKMWKGTVKRKQRRIWLETSNGGWKIV